MLVDIVLRSDTHLKPGGDSLQVQEYVSRLEAAGLSVRRHRYTPNMPLREQSLVHIVNVDRPYDFLDAFRQAGSRPVVVSPIHHRLEAVRQMRLAEPNQGLRSALGRLPEPVRELLAHAARTWKSGERSPVRMVALFVRASGNLPGLWRRVGCALDAAAAVAVLAEGEVTDLMTDTGWNARNRVNVPNGRPITQAAPPPWKGREREILVVGRIEPRKRQVDVARAAAARQIDVTFVGYLNGTTGAYAQTFLDLVDGSEHLTYLGAVSHGEVLELLRCSRVLLNCSWVEVQSLVDLEAADAGCWVVANTNGNSREWIGEGCVEIQPDAIADAVIMADRLARGVKSPPRLAYPWTWDDAADILIRTYGAA